MIKNDDGEKVINHRNFLVPIKIQGPAMAGNPNTIFCVKNHLRQFGSDVRIPKYCSSDPNYASTDNDPLAHEWFYYFADGKPISITYGVIENQYRCPDCGYSLGISFGLQSLLDHLHTTHGQKFKEINEINPRDFNKFREFDYVMD